MTRLRDSIKHAERQVWPAVKDALAATTTPVVIDKLVRTKQSRSNVRFVVEETIQALAAAGLLRTPVDADVIGKAVSWHESMDDIIAELVHEGRVEQEDVELYDAVEKMLVEVGDRPRP